MKRTGRTVSSYFCFLLCMVLCSGCWRVKADQGYPVPDLLPIHRAALAGDIQKVEAEIGKGVPVDAENKAGKATALQLAAGCGQVETMEYLLAHGANVNHRGRIGDTPLHTAATLGRYGAVECLLKHGADPGLRLDTGKTPLECALANEGLPSVAPSTDYKLTCDLLRAVRPTSHSQQARWEPSTTRR